jgi:hypothetical protein
VGVPEHGRFVVVGVRVERGAELFVLLVVVHAAAAALDGPDRTGGPVVNGAEAGCGEGGEHAWMGGDLFWCAFASAQSGRDQLEGIAAVDLRAGRTASAAAVVAADQQVTGRKASRVNWL